MSQFCVNHNDKKAFSICYSCQEYYCKDCLTEGITYYYCSKEKCQEKLKLEKQQADTSVNEKGGDKISLFNEFQNKLLVIITVSIIVAIIQTFLKNAASQNLVSVIPYILGAATGLVLIPFLLSLISIPFIKDSESKSSKFLTTFFIIWIIVLVFSTLGNIR